MSKKIKEILNEIAIDGVIVDLENPTEIEAVTQLFSILLENRHPEKNAHEILTLFYAQSENLHVSELLQDAIVSWYLIQDNTTLAQLQSELIPHNQNMNQ